MPHSQITFLERKLEDLSIPFDISVDQRTGSLQGSVSIPFSSSRNGFQPQLQLAYGSLGGNSEFGMGWALAGLPAIQIYTKEGRPKYDGSDEFAIGGARLVPWIDPNTNSKREFEKGIHSVQIFRPQKGEIYNRLEKWTPKNGEPFFWVMRTPNGATYIFGKGMDGSSRIFDPISPENVFSWLLEKQVDSYGNAINYIYKNENDQGIDLAQIFEGNRSSLKGNFAKKYLKRIQYGNSHPINDPISTDWTSIAWHFEAVFDYGEHAPDQKPGISESRLWTSRNDPFSNYYPGFEIRTHRLCRNILMFHRFPAQLGEPETLVGKLGLDYDSSDPAGVVLKEVSYKGFRTSNDSSIDGSKSIPPLVFDYHKSKIGQSFNHALNVGENIPIGIGGANYRWIDLYGEGLPGILFQDHSAWYFKSNLGNGKLSDPKLVTNHPAFAITNLSIEDFDGDGNLNAVTYTNGRAGYFEFDRENGNWSGFRTFPQSPSGTSNKIQFIDLTGNGRADLVQASEKEITIFQSEGRDGFSAPIKIPRQESYHHCQQVGQYLNLDYFWADMSGDGLPDQVRVYNGRVEYWPNLGHGKFGEVVVMGNSPILDYGHEFDASKVRIVNLNGKGGSDILYLGRGNITYWINQSGNSFSAPSTIEGLPHIDNISAVQIIDFLGDGTQCLVWSSVFGNHSQAQIHYLPILMAEDEGVLASPGMLKEVSNSMGLTTKIEYGYSGIHYLQAQNSCTPWETRLPSHSLVVNEFSQTDEIGNTSFNSSFRYNDGYFDGEEREFRGFSMVEQYDSEISLESGSFPAIEASTPRCVRTWYHNGSLEQKEQHPSFYDETYISNSIHRPEFDGILNLPSKYYTEAFRSLAGTTKRVEVYEVLPNGELLAEPLQLMQNGFRIVPVQIDEKDSRKSLFQALPTESISLELEKSHSDPRISQQINWDFDEFGQARRSATVGYPRLIASSFDQQTNPLISAQISSLENFDSDDEYRLGIPLEMEGFELNGINLGASPGSYSDLRAELESALANKIPFSTDPPAGKSARLISSEKLFYWQDDLSRSLPHGQATAKPLLHHSESAITERNHVESVFDTKLSVADFLSLGGYEEKNGLIWRSSEVTFYDSHLFFLPEKIELPNSGEIEYVYSTSGLVLIQVTDPLGNSSTAEIDYHLLAPWKITDINENISEVLYDPLGVVIVSSLQGEIEDDSGSMIAIGNEQLRGFTYEESSNIEDYFIDPNRFLQNRSSFFHYDFGQTDANGTIKRPPLQINLLRESWLNDTDGTTNSNSVIQRTISYLDGFGRIIQAKQKVESGSSIQRDASGALILNAGNPTFVDSASRWRVSGHQVFNQKQEVIRQYEPYFDSIFAFTQEAEIQSFGVSTDFFYDALGRNHLTHFPNGTRTKSEFHPWRIEQYDPNDFILGSQYDALKSSIPDDTDPEKIAWKQATEHNNTPNITHLDGAARAFATESTDPEAGTRKNRTQLDINGNATAIFDALDRDAFTYILDMAGRPLYQKSIDAGEKWALLDSMDQVISSWDAKGTQFEVQYDTLNRPISRKVTELGGATKLVERFEYGDTLPNGTSKNLKGQLVKIFDGAGTQEFLKFDLLGNPLKQVQRIAEDYITAPEWTVPANVALLPDRYESKRRFDAMGRPVWESLPDDTERLHEYNLLGMTAKASILIPGEASPRAMLNSIDYNARGQITQKALAQTSGEEVLSEYFYEHDSFRLRQLRTRKGNLTSAGRKSYQDIHYTYDPVGNIIVMDDKVQSQVNPPIPGANTPTLRSYEYDAFYQLRKASGRIHQSLQKFDYAHAPNAPGFIKGTRHVTLANRNMIDRYKREYQYDLNGNLTQMDHRLAGPGAAGSHWLRKYLIDPNSNRAVPEEDKSGIKKIPLIDFKEYFDPNGNYIKPGHFEAINWNYNDRLQSATFIDRGAFDRNDGEFYTYGADGMRMRKVMQTQTASGMEITEKIYLDGCEIKLIRKGTKISLHRNSSHIHANGERIATLLRWEEDTSGLETKAGETLRVHYSLSDHLGSTALEISDAGEVLSYEEYFPFGGAAFVYGDEIEVSTREYRYSGKERDDATGFYYYGFRYYAPWLGRWLRPDPIGPEDGVNLYAFVGNNPVNGVDKDGLQSTATYEPDVVALLVNYNQYHQENSDIGFVFSFNGTLFSFSTQAGSFIEARQKLPESIFVNDEIGEINPRALFDRALGSLVQPIVSGFSELVSPEDIISALSGQNPSPSQAREGHARQRPEAEDSEPANPANELQRNAQRLNENREEVLEEIEEQRVNFSIPETRRELGGIPIGGWVISSPSGGSIRIDFSYYTTSEGRGRNELTIFRILEKLSDPEIAESVQSQLDALRTVNPDIDPALVLTVAGEETRGLYIFETRGRISHPDDTFSTGGLDNAGYVLGRLRRFLPQGYGSAWTAVDPYTTDEHRTSSGERRPIQPVTNVPHNELLSLYGAYLELIKEDIVFGPQGLTEEEKVNIDVDTTRFLTRLAFGSRESFNTVLQEMRRIRDEDPEINSLPEVLDLREDQLLNKVTGRAAVSLRRSLVSIANARVLENLSLFGGRTGQDDN
ncbi:MAG: hypothetical protein H6581_20465 [Bacteroidia bacterium]|nr:hypothetical protein [Bacteroidia bacterium]